MPDRRLAAVFALGLIAGLAGEAPAQGSKFDAAGSFKSYEFLLVNESVQNELKLSDEQVLKVNTTVHDIRQKRRAELEKLRNLPAPKGREKFLQILEENAQEALDSSAKILTAEQVKRLKQIRVQQDGFDAFYNDAVSAALKLSKEQQQRIKKIDREAETQGEKPPQVGTGGNYATTMTRMAARRKDLIGKAVDLLTAEQKTVWTDLVGAPFDFMPRARGVPKQQKSEPKKSS
jgi:hypothetical protein